MFSNIALTNESSEFGNSQPGNGDYILLTQRYKHLKLEQLILSPMN